MVVRASRKASPHSHIHLLRPLTVASWTPTMPRATETAVLCNSLPDVATIPALTLSWCPLGRGTSLYSSSAGSTGGFNGGGAVWLSVGGRGNQVRGIMLPHTALAVRASLVSPIASKTDHQRHPVCQQRGRAQQRRRYAPLYWTAFLSWLTPAHRFCYNFLR